MNGEIDRQEVNEGIKLWFKSIIAELQQTQTLFASDIKVKFLQALLQEHEEAVENEQFAWEAIQEFEERQIGFRGPAYDEAI